MLMGKKKSVTVSYFNISFLYQSQFFFKPFCVAFWTIFLCHAMFFFFQLQYRIKINSTHVDGRYQQKMKYRRLYMQQAYCVYFKVTDNCKVTSLPA